VQREAEPSLSPGQARRSGPLGQAANHVTQAWVEGSAGTRTMAAHATCMSHHPANDDEKCRDSVSVTRAGYDLGATITTRLRGLDAISGHP
jgi:hypothetical protein